MKTYITISAVALATILGAGAEVLPVKVNLGTSVTATGSSMAKMGSTTMPKMEMKSETAVGVETTSAVVNVELNVVPFSVMRDDNMEKEKMEINSDTDVKSNADLSVFAKTMVKKDENVKNVEVDKDNVSMEYKAKVWFLGFIPFTTNATVNVENSGAVNVSYPWYTFLASTNKAEIETNVKFEITPVIKSSSNAKLSTKAKAELLTKVQAVLRSDLEASAKAESSN